MRSELKDRLAFDTPDEELTRALRALQGVIFKHPVAAQSAFRALVAEGRAWASTAEGAAWKERLAESELVARARIAWEGTTMNVLDPDGEQVLPSTLLDAVIAAAGHAGVEALLARLYAEEPGSA